MPYVDLIKLLWEKFSQESFNKFILKIYVIARVEIKNDKKGFCIHQEECKQFTISKVEEFSIIYVLVCPVDIMKCNKRSHWIKFYF